MAASPIVPIPELDLSQTLFSIDEIREANPHRDHMELLDRVVAMDTDSGWIVATKTIGDDEFWNSGHFPGRPIFPGVMMIEAHGQVASVYCAKNYDHGKIMVFAGVEKVRFRGMVTPGDELLIMGKKLLVRRNMMKFSGQCWLNPTEKDPQLVYEGEIMGVLVD